MRWPVLACIVLALAGCAHREQYRGGVYTNFTFAPALHDTPSAANDAIARDERTLAEDAAADQATLKAALADVAKRLCAAHDERELKRVVETYAGRVHGLSDVALSCDTAPKAKPRRSGP